ncbi:alpha/beta hydrolase [Actinoplanes philippinensis]|uniref:Pimeloyl-ACP methyl ester carboxylesterase n=1 Tax=Actinoplanes philippinensis TaxID=35752 RepID=A0A1I2K4L4_9ACTN|nr:alpha/beta fold hydrolase [Actinoplanes philippinensis]GIE81410.1 alpha/beta hydrolase [Actinoplanes philippinensis]SFF61279.1 Pimeloyl-ACP methyl ester carboxylesterase [Actinoplanes philippinensis]
MIHRHSGLVFAGHTLAVPLNHADPDGPRIEIFAREVREAGVAAEGRPFLLYLQGGPGNRSPRDLPVWLRRAARDYRVVLLDQRGTGRSTPLTRQTLAGVEDQAGYLAHFRADSIVADAELLRAHLAGDRPWSVLGQSFGGFCAVSYLSFAPHGLREVIITGGLPGLTATAEDVYRAAYPRVLAHNERYFERYPEDEAIARRVVDALRDQDARLPAGDRLTPRRFQTLGIHLGSNARFDSLHHLLEEAFAGDDLSELFLRRVDAAVSFVEQPLFAVLHEAIYGQGAATGWAAHRVRDEFPAFDLDAGGPVRFTGEMIYPWLFEEDPALVPLAGAAARLATKADWAPLYDLDRLAANEVPVAAAVYFDDMYVDRDMSLATARHIRNVRPWVTNEYAHDGLGRDERVLDRLLTMVKD